ncbi:MAG: AmmeMemoRadiSam system protein A [Candidatus Acidiferrales bacterium]
MSRFADREKQSLLELARRALTAGVKEHKLKEEIPNDKTLMSPGGAFVTLHRRGHLRGCVGQLPSGESLAAVVAHCAQAAALEDPRFEPVSPEELPEIEIELSVLSQLEKLSIDDMNGGKIETGKHGLVVSRGQQRGVLLPQVATNFNWQAQRFLEETCVKAGMESDAWKDPQTRVEVFTAEVFRESTAQSGQKTQ